MIPAILAFVWCGLLTALYEYNRQSAVRNCERGIALGVSPHFWAQQLETWKRRRYITVAMIVVTVFLPIAFYV